MIKKEFYKERYAMDSQGHLPDKYRTILNIIASKSPRQFLDIGCGDGFFSALVRERCPDAGVFGVDVSAEAVAKAKEKGIRAFCVDIDVKNFPFADKSFDVIFCGEIIEHLFDPDHLLTEIHRVLKDEGSCFLTTPNLGAWFNRVALLLGFQPFFSEVSTRQGVGHLFPFWLNAGHMRLFTYKALRQLIRIYHFDIVKTYGFGINAELGLGKRLRFLSVFSNHILRFFPSLLPDILVVFKKTLS